MVDVEAGVVRLMEVFEIGAARAAELDGRLPTPPRGARSFLLLTCIDVPFQHQLYVVPEWLQPWVRILRTRVRTWPGTERTREGTPNRWMSPATTARAVAADVAARIRLPDMGTPITLYSNHGRGRRLYPKIYMRINQLDF